MEHIPIVDLSGITGASKGVETEELNNSAQAIFKALSGIGFAYVLGHGIDQQIIDSAFSASRKFFQLPQKVKDIYLKDKEKSYHGYAQHVGKFSESEHRERWDICGADRLYPDLHCPEFGGALDLLEIHTRRLAKLILKLMALAIKPDDANFFFKLSQNLDFPEVKSYTSLRTLYYPKVPDDIAPGTVRLVEHSDYGVITLLFQDQVGGLMVKSLNGKWIQAKPVPGTVLVNTGDLLEFWTGGVFPATKHQVLIPEEELSINVNRQSIALFVHPDDDVIVSPLIGDDKEYGAVAAKEHAARKLKLAYN